MQDLDLTTIPLSDFNLIEASAGTGKTYTITALYVRLVVEAQLAVKRILVVTYTNAATKELRDRIRSRLAEILGIFLGNPPDPQDTLATHLLQLTQEPEVTIRRLQNALRGFDEASIFTIHGFCKRVLADNAFESGLAFESELLADTGELLQEIVEDFWRREFYHGSPLVVRYLLDSGISPNSLLQQISPHLGKPYLQVVTPNRGVNYAQLECDFKALFQQAATRWEECSAAVEELLLNYAGLNRQTYKKASIAQWIAAMQAYLHTTPPSVAVFKDFEKFTSSFMAKKTKQKHCPPQHPFFDICDRLWQISGELADYYRYQIPAKLLDYCNDELARRKQRDQVQSYDDLLLNLHHALRPDSKLAAKLCKALRERYQAALIDEFQDTDPVQYDIFQRIYAHSQQPVFLVGDPKQAIYSFRGADIFAYIAARKNIASSNQHTLRTNWRSTPRLLEAVNAVFSGAPAQPFLFDDIPFHHALPTPRSHPPSLLINGTAPPPLQLWLLPKTDKAPINKGAAESQAAAATANEIAHLLQLAAAGHATLGERALAGGDIAILVRSHRQGRLMRRELLRRNIPSVQHADDSVFSSAEAQQLEWLLAAVSAPSQEGRLRTVLASPLYGCSGEELYRLREHEAEWTRWLEKFQGYQLLWREHGFMRFFRAWLVGDQVAERLLNFRDGERRLTNLLHLGELAYLASRTHPGMINLCKWLSNSRALPNHREEEQQLRLESDAHLVRIVTVHKSKGLEYEVVFCPFLWSGVREQKGDTALLYHDPKDAKRSILSIGGAANALHLAQREAIAENLRLFYVALTRAKQCCYLVWGQINGAETAPPMWFLHHPQLVGPDQDALELGKDRFKILTPEAFHHDLQQRFAATAATMHTLEPTLTTRVYQAASAVAAAPQVRNCCANLSDPRRIGSFSALTSGLSADSRDYDLTSHPLPSTTSTPQLSAFHFPRGARAGSCLHALLQRLDYQHLDTLEDEVQRTLHAHGFAAPLWTATVTAWMQQVLATPLNAAGLRLDQLRQRSHEMEFFYPVPQLKVEELRQVLYAHGYHLDPYRSMVERLEFRTLRGYLRGFIDLVFAADGRFYLADYKSNWLGERSADYAQARLATVMADNNYVLQYLIYSIALQRHLQLRIPDYRHEHHFGGVFYLFLRGMQPELGADYGVFHVRPSAALLEDLDALLRRSA